MYRIDKQENNVEKLEPRLFKDLKLRERDHLQEWIVKNPEMLGEELLVIQKEFDGFSETNERLDVLAIDKEGNLVIIENKLDDSGRHVVWQALKYASYCSTLTTAQIIQIYQAYLDKFHLGENALQNLIEFLDRSEDDLLLNKNDQRIIFVANNYRKEVTSTVLWLLNHDILIKCFRATPYSMGETLFLQIEQIIPLPETNEFIIDIKEKAKDEIEKSKTIEHKESQLVKFWNLLKIKLQAKKYDYIEHVSSKPDYSIGFSKGKGRYSFCIGRFTYRVELYFPDDSNKLLIDAMYHYHDEITAKFTEKIEWERLDGKKASRIKIDMPFNIGKGLNGRFSNEPGWDEQMNWFVDTMHKFYTNINPYWSKVQEKI